ncbi:hypothetical protein V2J09_023280 [Rumex salicifolius]
MTSLPIFLVTLICISQNSHQRWRSGDTDGFVVDSRRRTSMVDGDNVVVEDGVAALIRREEGDEVGVALPERRPCRR